MGASIDSPRRYNIANSMEMLMVKICLIKLNLIQLISTNSEKVYHCWVLTISMHE